jgi:DNA-binding IclR family transcriptional regulator
MVLMGNPARILQTVDNSLRILNYLGKVGQPRTLAEIAKAGGLAKSVTHSVLYTLRQRGFVEQDLLTRRYSLGLQLVTLGQVAARRLDLRTVAQPFMSELARLTDESVYLMVRGRNMCVLLDRVDPLNPLKVTMEVGQEGYFHAGSSNKAILAFLPDAEIERVIQEVGLPAFTAATITNRAALWAQVHEVRDRYYSYTEEESFVGIAGLAAPVMDRTGQVVASVGIAGVVQRLRLNQQACIPEVIRIAGGISAALGHVAGFDSPFNLVPSTVGG